MEGVPSNIELENLEPDDSLQVFMDACDNSIDTINDTLLLDLDTNNQLQKAVKGLMEISVKLLIALKKRL